MGATPANQAAEKEKEDHDDGYRCGFGSPGDGCRWDRRWDISGSGR